MIYQIKLPALIRMEKFADLIAEMLCSPIISEDVHGWQGEDWEITWFDPEESTNNHWRIKTKYPEVVTMALLRIKG